MSLIQGKTFMQPFYWWLQRTANSGLNIGKGGTVATSGELFVLQYVKKMLLQKAPKEPLCIFDVGANVGDFAIETTRCFSSSAIIHCFEPGATTFRMLKENLSHFESNIILHPFGLGDHPSTQTLYYNHEGSGWASVYKIGIGCKSEEHPDLLEESITLNSIDNFVASEKIPHIHFLKIDVEGHELSVLNGAKKLINKNAIDFIQFEFGPTNIDSRTYFRDFWFLLNKQYSFFRILQNGLCPITKYDSRHEVFRTTNFLLERRNF